MCRNSAVPRTNWMLLSDPSENSPTGPLATLAAHSTADTAARTRANITMDRTSHLSEDKCVRPMGHLLWQSGRLRILRRNLPGAGLRFLFAQEAIQRLHEFTASGHSHFAFRPRRAPPR